jgi:uncharacterized protein
MIVRNIEVLHAHTSVIREKARGHRVIDVSIASAVKSQDGRTKQRGHIRKLAQRLHIKEYTIRPVLPLGRATEFGETRASCPVEMYMSPLDDMLAGFMPLNSCGIGDELYIEPTGEAYPCYACHKPSAFLGNAIKDSIDNIVKSDAFRTFRSYSVDTNEGCRVCDYRYLCGGACKAWEPEENKHDLDAAPTDCSGLKRRAEKLHLLALEYLGLV